MRMIRVSLIGAALFAVVPGIPTKLIDMNGRVGFRDFGQPFTRPRTLCDPKRKDPMTAKLINHDAARKEVDAAAEKMAKALERSRYAFDIGGPHHPGGVISEIDEALAAYRKLVPGDDVKGE